MHVGKTLFAQLMDFLPWTTFRRIVARYGGDHRVRSLTCAEHYRVMAFAQLTYRESLRDIETCLTVQASKLYGMGFRQPVRRATLADANEARDWRMYAELAQRLIAQARKLYADGELDVPGAVSVLLEVDDVVGADRGAGAVPDVEMAPAVNPARAEAIDDVDRGECCFRRHVQPVRQVVDGPQVRFGLDLVVLTEPRAGPIAFGGRGGRHALGPIGVATAHRGDTEHRGRGDDAQDDADRGRILVQVLAGVLGGHPGCSVESQCN